MKIYGPSSGPGVPPLFSELPGAQAVAGQPPFILIFNMSMVYFNMLKTFQALA